jgi:hypothetical protein
MIDGFILDRADEAEASRFTLPIRVEQTLMTDLAGKQVLARGSIAFCEALAAGRRLARRVGE